MAVSNARGAEVADRRARLIRMRVEKIPFDEIARELGYSSEAVARKDLTVACRAARALEVEAAEDRRYLEGLSLDLLEATYMPKAVAGDLQSAEFVRKIIADRVKLYGCAAPLQVEATVTELTQQDVALQEMISEARMKNAAKLEELRARAANAKAPRGDH
jgi:hypothetical protein